MNLGATRDQLAAAAPAAGLHGYREPPGEFLMPALLVLDPQTVEYHQSWDGTEPHATFYARVIVPAQLGNAAALDALLSGPLRTAVEQHDSGGVWQKAVVLRKLPGPYTQFQDKGDRLLGLGADVEIRITYP